MFRKLRFQMIANTTDSDSTSAHPKPSRWASVAPSLLGYSAIFFRSASSYQANRSVSMGFTSRGSPREDSLAGDFPSVDTP